MLLALKGLPLHAKGLLLQIEGEPLLFYEIVLKYAANIHKLYISV